MLIAEARERLERRAAERGVDLRFVDPRTALDLVLGWFEEERASDAEPLDEDGDGLLVQWGPRSFDVTRQFAQGECLWQLSLTLHYEPDAALGSGSEWCFDPAGLAGFPSLLPAPPGRPRRVTLEFGEAC